MTETKAYRRGTILFREGDPGECMYDIQFGRVGIYHDYGGPNEKRIAVLATDDYLGEMGLLEGAPRSATAVVLDDNTAICTIKEDDFYEYFEQNPAKILMLMQQMCTRLRKTTKDYVEACKTVYDTVEAEKAGEKKSGSLLERIQKFCNFYRDFGSHV